MAEINRFNTASLITRTTNDVQQVQMLITIGLQMMVKAPITAVWAITKIAGKQWQWSLSVAVAVIFMLTCIAIVLLLVTPKFVKVQKLTDDMKLRMSGGCSAIWWCLCPMGCRLFLPL